MFVQLPQDTSEDGERESDKLELSLGIFNLLGLDPEASQESNDEDSEPAAKHPWNGNKRDAEKEPEFRRPQERWCHPAAACTTVPPKPTTNKQEEAPSWVATPSRDVQLTCQVPG